MSASANSPEAGHARGRLKLALIALVCLTPMVASYLEYYVIQPQTRNNYGTLIEPQRSMPKLTLHELDGRDSDEGALAGKWLLVSVDSGPCAKTCENKLYHMRQLRLTTGRERERVLRVWIITDDTPVPDRLLHEYEGTLILRGDASQLGEWLPADSGASVSDHIFIVDPHRNLMMRFPRDPDPRSTKRDLIHLLAASSIG